MILTNRLFQRAAPSRDAKVFYIFCEGRCRENEYFNYFEELDSRIILKIVPPEDSDNNSPEGLYKKACNFLVKTKDNPNPQYEFSNVDEVWFVIDTDQWKGKIDNLRKNCLNHERWMVAQSNPCFEVWLYYHLHSQKPKPEDVEKFNGWKSFVNKSIKGGFDSRKHSIFIGTAIENTKKNYSETNGKIDIACTEVFKLAETFYPFVKSVIEEGLKHLRK